MWRNKIKKVVVIATVFTMVFLASIFSQDTAEIIKNIDRQLKNGETTISNVLSDESKMYLHSLIPFREVIKRNAKAEQISIVSKNEPGTRILVKGKVVNVDETAIKDLIVYVYQTSDKGWYSDTAAHILIPEGDFRHARLFGYLKTNDKGEFSFETIKPKGYPKSDLAAHIHIHFWTKDSQPVHGPGELQFDDDPRMTPERRKKSLEEGFLISKNSGTEQSPVYSYKILAEKQ